MIANDDKFTGPQPDSLMALLIAQCSDLEALLLLAKRETLAAEKSDFGELMMVVQDRATLGERLESYHRQIAELRKLMVGKAEPLMNSTSAQDAVRLVIEIQSFDIQTTALLATRRIEAREAIARLDHGRQFIAYLSGARSNGFKCDEVA